MHILVVNPGSSSIKCMLQNMESGTILWTLKIAQYTSNDVRLVRSHQGQEVVTQLEPNTSYGEWLHILVEQITKLYSFQSGDCIAYRVVHGGYFDQPILLTEESMKTIFAYSEFAPLHNPVAIETIEYFDQYSPGFVEHWAVFDSALFTSLPRPQQATGLPQQVETALRLRRFGFHGISYSGVLHTLTKDDLLLDSTRLIVCHLGNGCSVAGFTGTQPKYISMGMGPGTGVMSATRSGDVDWEALLYWIERDEIDTRTVRELLYHEGGLKSWDGKTGFMLEIMEKSFTSPQSKQAVEAFVSSVSSHIMRAASACSGIDMLVFTGGIGYGSEPIREMICTSLSWLGVRIDQTQTTQRGIEDLTGLGSSVLIMKIEAQEEQEISRQVFEVIQKRQKQ